MASIFDKTRDLLKTLKQGASNFAQYTLPQTAARVASSPQLNKVANTFQNTAQPAVNYLKQPVQQRVGQILQKVPEVRPFGQYTETLAPGLVYGPQLAQSFGRTMERAWDPKLAVQQYKAKPFATGIEDFGNIPGANAMVAVAPLLAGMAKVKFDAKKVKLATSSIERLGKISRNIDYLQPASKMSAYTLADDLMKKFLPGMAKNPEVKIMAQREPDRWLKLVSTYLDDQLIKAKNPELKLGFSTEAIKRSSQSPLYDTINEGGVIKKVEGRPVKIVEGIETFIHKGDNPKRTIKGFVVSEKTTGRYIGSGETESQAIQNAKNTISEAGVDKLKQALVKYQLKPNVAQGGSTGIPQIKPNQSSLYDTKGKIYYHASDKPITEFKNTGKPTYLSQDVNFGKHYIGENAVNTRVKADLGKSIILDDKTINKLFEKHFGGTPELRKTWVDDFNFGMSDRRGDVLTWLKQEGYDSAVIKNDWNGGMGQMESTVVFNPAKQLKVEPISNTLQNVAQGGLSVQPKAEVKTKAEIPGRILPQSEVLATTKQGKQILPTEKPTTVGGGAGSPSSEDIITDPVQKITALLKEAKPMRAQQEALYSAERARRAGAIAGIGKNVKGEAGYFAQLSKLKGELPKVEFERIRNGLKQTDIDSLFNKVEDANITPFEKISAKSGLAKLLGAEGGQVPVESELKLLGEIFPPDFIEAIMAKRPFVQRLWSGIQGVLNLPRAVMATADLSAPLRQGFFFISRLKQWLPAFKEMFKYAFSEKAYLGLMDDIKARPNYLKMRESKLALTDMGPNLLAREEEFMSNLAEKIPLFGSLAKGSNRAYSGFLNKLRADVFDDLVSKAELQGVKLQVKTLDDLASFINSATGRGNLGKTMQKAAPILNGVFFSPRLMASRINLLNPATYVKYDPFVRKEALKSLIGTGATALTVLGLAKLAGAEVGNDPRSADFGKIKVGNTRYDVLGGFQQYIKLMAQLASGQVVSSTTGKVVTLGEGYKPLTRKDILLRFFEAKTSPVASFVISLMTGQTGVGEPVNVPTEVINRFIPMMAQDIYDISREKDSVGKGLFMAIPGIFGAGSQTYGKSEYVEGTNKVGQPTSQIRPVQGMAETISEKVFGQQPLGSSSTFNIQSFIKDIKTKSPEERTQIWNRIVETNPDLAKKIKQVIEDEKKGITPQDQTLKDKGVASGDRAQAIYKELNRLKTSEEKSNLWNDYVKKGIITKEVAKQLKILLAK